MSKLTHLNKLFKVGYGNKFDLNKMEKVSKDKKGILFVSRSAKNLGIVSKVREVENVTPYPSGLITVALGGSVLSSSIQEEPFYTAQNIAVLNPLKDMSFKEKLFYCMCIEKNRFRYSTFGREANRTLGEILVPENVPSWVESTPMLTYGDLSAQLNKVRLNLKDKNWKQFRYDYIFDIKKGERITNDKMLVGKIPCIRPRSDNNGIFKYIDIPPNHKGNTITVSYNGSVGEAFYQPIAHFSLDDINVLYPKFELNVFSAMFLITLIRREKYRFNYGRKWNLDRMNETKMKLPVDVKGEPDWKFMENYIKSLRYSRHLESLTS